MAIGAARALLERHAAAPPKAKKAAGDVELCAHCGGRNPTQKCGRCRVVKYCNAPCQKVHWKAGDHKQACLAPEQRTREAATAACQAALVQSPAASRAALANHRAAIDPALAKMLAIVGGYTCDVPPPLPRVRVLCGCSCLQSNDVICVFILRPTLLIPLSVLSLCAVRVILAAPVSFQEKATPLYQVAVHGHGEVVKRLFWRPAQTSMPRPM